MSRVLVVGAKEGSLGHAITANARLRHYDPITAGVDREDRGMDIVTDPIGKLRRMLIQIEPQHIVCTVGMNDPEPKDLDDPTGWYAQHYLVNAISPMRLLQAWQDVLGAGDGWDHHFVAISSNSARLPRSSSAAYCASKAALSMALRVKAREGKGDPVTVYGYEPGLIENTPMTAQTAQDFPGVPLTRMRPEVLARGISRMHVAELVVNGLALGRAMNGLLVPFDADEA